MSEIASKMFKGIEVNQPHHYQMIGNKRVRVYGKRYNPPRAHARQQSGAPIGTGAPSRIASPPVAVSPLAGKTLAMAQNAAFLAAYGATERACGLLQNGSTPGEELQKAIEDLERAVHYFMEPFFVNDRAAIVFAEIERLSALISQPEMGNVEYSELLAHLEDLRKNFRQAAEYFYVKPAPIQFIK